MKLGVVIPLWKREGITRLTLRRVSRATQADSNCVLVAVTDEKKNAKSAQAFGFEVVSAPNKPLSDKKNAGVKHLQGRVDGVIFIGSDDWVASLRRGKSFLDLYREKLQEHPCLGPLDMWYADAVSLKAGYDPGYTGKRAGEPIGVGRAMRSDVLDALDWLPRPSNLAKDHDYNMCLKLKKHGFVFKGFQQAEIGVRFLDIKSELSVTAYRRLKLRPLTWKTAFQPFPKAEVAELVKLVKAR